MLNTMRFGIEIETVGLGREALANAIHSVIGGTKTADYGSWKITDANGRAWKVVADGSLSGGEMSGEIVSPILGYDEIEVLQQVVRAVRHAGGRADATCGIHYAWKRIMRAGPPVDRGSPRKRSVIVPMASA